MLTSGAYGLALGHKTNLKEKRTLAKAPEYEAMNLLDKRYYTKLSKFLDDRYPYRTDFITVKNWIAYYIFNTSPSPKVHMGKDGWFYLKAGLRDYLVERMLPQLNLREKALVWALGGGLRYKRKNPKISLVKED